MDAPFVGIDVSKSRLDVAVYPTHTSFAVGNDGAGLDELVARLAPLQAAVIGVEATGGYEREVVAALAAAGLPVVILNPRQVRAFADALGKRAKTDPIDAYVIARYVAAVGPDIRPLPSDDAQALSDLVGRRKQIVDMLVAERQRGQRARRKSLRKSIDRLVAALEKELASLDTDLDAMIKASPVWNAKAEILRSAPGIAHVLARKLIADLPELGTISGKQIAALVGLAPFTRQSGQWKGKSFTGGGRACVRTALVLAAMTASRFDREMKAFRQRLLDAGKSKMVALVAVARKLVTRLNAMLRDGKPWVAKPWVAMPWDGTRSDEGLAQA